MTAVTAVSPCLSVVCPGGSKIRPCTFHQVEENAVLIGYERYVKFVDKQGKLKPSSKQASQLSFDNKGHAFGKHSHLMKHSSAHGGGVEEGREGGGGGEGRGRGRYRMCVLC